MPITDSNLTLQDLVEIFTEAGCESTDKAGLLAFNKKLTAERSEGDPLRQFVGVLTKAGEEMKDIDLFDRITTDFFSGYATQFSGYATQSDVCRIGVTIARNQLSRVLQNTPSEHLLEIACLAMEDWIFPIKIVALFSYLRKRNILVEAIIESKLLERCVSRWATNSYTDSVAQIGGHIDECEALVSIIKTFSTKPAWPSVTSDVYDEGLVNRAQGYLDTFTDIGPLFVLRIAKECPSINIESALRQRIRSRNDLYRVISWLEEYNFWERLNPVDNETTIQKFTMVFNAVGIDKLNELLVIDEASPGVIDIIKRLQRYKTMLLPISLLDILEARGDTLDKIIRILSNVNDVSRNQLLFRWASKLPTLITNPKDLERVLRLGIDVLGTEDYKALARNRVLLAIKGHIAQFDSEEMHRVFSPDNDYSQDVFNVFKETQRYTLGLSFYEKRYAESNTGTLAQKLNKYIAVRTKEGGSFHWDFLWIKTFVYWLTGQEYKSKDSKISAANALLTSLDNNAMNDHQLLLGVDVIHHKALTDGLLGEIVQGHVEQGSMCNHRTM